MEKTIYRKPDVDCTIDVSKLRSYNHAAMARHQNPLR